jgi:hypothetical protein
MVGMVSQDLKESWAMLDLKVNLEMLAFLDVME